MAFSKLQIALSIALFGSLAFIFGVIAENKKPASGIPVQGKGVVICKYPTDPTVLLGILSLISFFMTTLIGIRSVFYPYKGNSVPTAALFRNTTLLIFFSIAVGMTVLANGMMIWAIASEALHRTHNIHHDLENQCPTAKAGLFGGAAFLALDAALLWFVCQMLTLNARADYLNEDDNDDAKGDYGQVLAADHDVNSPGHARPMV